MMNKDIAKYKLQINSPQALKPKDNFIKFYSGGPKKFEEEPIYVIFIKDIKPKLKRNTHKF